MVHKIGVKKLPLCQTLKVSRFEFLEMSLRLSSKIYESHDVGGLRDVINEPNLSKKGI